MVDELCDADLSLDLSNSFMLQELVDTEETYVKDLEHVCKVGLR